MPSQTAVEIHTEPAAWNIGAITRMTSSGASGAAELNCSALASSARCVSITPFDAPVVPPV